MGRLLAFWRLPAFLTFEEPALAAVCDGELVALLVPPLANAAWLFLVDCILGWLFPLTIVSNRSNRILSSSVLSLQCFHQSLIYGSGVALSWDLACHLEEISCCCYWYVRRYTLSSGTVVRSAGECTSAGWSRWQVKISDSSLAVMMQWWCNASAHVSGATLCLLRFTVSERLKTH